MKPNERTKLNGLVWIGGKCCKFFKVSKEVHIYKLLFALSSNFLVANTDKNTHIHIHIHTHAHILHKGTLMQLLHIKGNIW